MTADTLNVDPQELAKFNDIAHQWWDPHGEFKPLHDINPLRLDYIEQHCALSGIRVADVGCGGGILSEGMSKRGALVTGIDLAIKSLGVARLHLYESGLQIDYRETSAEALASAEPGQYHCVTCLEMLEHVPEPASIVAAAATLATAGGWVFFSTISRNPKAYVHAVLGAEYLLRLLPRGTHDYRRFIKPSELARMARHAGLDVVHIAGMGYDLARQQYQLHNDASVNYLMACRKPLV